MRNFCYSTELHIDDRGFGFGIKLYPTNVLEGRADLLVVELWNSLSQFDPVFSNDLFY
jgi:hypothetical protein